MDMTQAALAEAFERARSDGHALPGNIIAAPDAIDVVEARSLGGRLDAIWDDLSSRAGEPNAFARRWFMKPSLLHSGENQGEMLVAMQQGCAIGLLPLQKHRFYGRIPAPHLRSFSHPNMFLSPVTLAVGNEDAAWRALLETLARRGDHYALFGPFDRDGPIARALRKVAEESGRSLRPVRCEERALYQSDLAPEDYWVRSVRSKKRKELRRQERRLSELGTVGFTRLTQAGDVDRWCRDFLVMEATGWKGRKGSALAMSERTASLFRAIMDGAWRADCLALCRLTLDDRPVAMLATLIDGRGGFSFKTTYDEALAPYSPGVLLQYHNLDLPKCAGVDWIDSCAVPDHPMIESLWAERRSLESYAISLQTGLSRSAFNMVHRAKALKRDLLFRRNASNGGAR